MTLFSSITLFAIMAALAALPSSSVLLVVAQSASKGVKNGIATALGVVTGDLIFMSMAILGMTALAEQMGTFFVLVKYIAGAYLIWFGIGLIRSSRNSASVDFSEGFRKVSSSNLAMSFGSGLLLTLGDIKAIVFYASLLPTFIDLATLTAMDVIIISIITIVAVGGVKIVFAFSAEQVSRRAFRFNIRRKITATSGGVMIGAGTYVLLRE